MTGKQGMAAVAAVAACAALLAGCGGGGTGTGSAVPSLPAPTPPALSDGPHAPAVAPQALAMAPLAQAAGTPTAAQRNVALLHQGAFGRAPSNATYTSSSQLAASNLAGMVAGVNDDLAALDDAALAQRVVKNLRVTAQSVTTPGAVDAIQIVLQQLFASYGKASRATVVLNAATLLGGLEADATWGAAAKLLNAQVQANHTYSSDASRLVSHVVTPGGNAASNQPVYADCLNPALYATGASYQINISAPGSGPITVATSVGQRVNFRGTSAMDLAETLTGSNAAGQTTVVRTHYYRDLTDAGLVDAGFETTVAVAGYGNVVLTNVYTPVSLFPGNLKLNELYHDDVKATTSASNPALGGTQTAAADAFLYFLGVEQITTPAGTFAACKRQRMVITSKPSVDQIWTVADGRFKGLQLQFVDINKVVQTTTRLVLNGVSSP